MSAMLCSHHHYPFLERITPSRNSAHITQQNPSPLFSFLPGRTCFLQAPRVSQTPSTDFCGRFTSRRIHFPRHICAACVTVQSCRERIPLHENTTLLHAIASGRTSELFPAFLSTLTLVCKRLHCTISSHHPHVFLFYNLWEILYSLQIKWK